MGKTVAIVNGVNECFCLFIFNLFIGWYYKYISIIYIFQSQ